VCLFRIRFNDSFLDILHFFSQFVLSFLSYHSAPFAFFSTVRKLHNCHDISSTWVVGALLEHAGHPAYRAVYACSDIAELQAGVGRRYYWQGKTLPVLTFAFFTFEHTHQVIAVNSLFLPGHSRRRRASWATSCVRPEGWDWGGRSSLHAKEGRYPATRFGLRL
jgi:hypothetical protein